MTFDILSKELYSLKLGLGEKVPEFRVYLSQQVMILQSEYPGRIQPKHVKEIKCDHLYEGLNPEYWCMLAHKVDSENPAGYSDLLLAAWKLERRAKARDPLPPKTAVTSQSNICSQTQGNLFPSCKLKGSCTFTNYAATVGNAKGKADSGVKQEGEGEMEPLADKEVKASGRVQGTDQPMEYIFHFAKVVELYKQKNRHCLGCWSPDQLMQDCPKDFCKSAKESRFKHKRGDGKEGWLGPSEASCHSESIPGRDSTNIRHCKRLPSWIKTPSVIGVDPKT